jgi:hypothetical protein
MRLVRIVVRIRPDSLRGSLKSVASLTANPHVHQAKRPVHEATPPFLEAERHRLEVEHSVTGGDDPDPSWEYWVDVEEGLREAEGRSIAVSDEPHIPADEGC